jgi:hypothetical protein
MERRASRRAPRRLCRHLAGDDGEAERLARIPIESVHLPLVPAREGPRRCAVTVDRISVTGSCCARPLHAKRRRRGLTGGRRPLSDTRRAHWRFLAAATSTGCSAKRRPAQRCLRGTAPENMRVCRVRGRAESAITSQWHLPRQGPGRRRCRGSVGTLDILLQPIALEGAIDQDHDCSFVFGDTGIVRGAERTSRDAAHEQRCGRGFEIEGEYAAHLSLSSGVSAAPAACEGRPGLRAR